MPLRNNAIILLVATAAAKGSGSCTFVQDKAYNGAQAAGRQYAGSAADCCASCKNQTGCAFFTWVPLVNRRPATCFMMTGIGSPSDDPGAVSGNIAPPAAQQQTEEVHIDAKSALQVVAPNFLGCNIDAASLWQGTRPHRLNFSDTGLLKLGKVFAQDSQDSILRIGGSSAVHIIRVGACAWTDIIKILTMKACF